MFGIHVHVVHGGGAHIVLGGGPCVVYHDVYGGPHVVYGQSQFFVWGIMVCIQGHRRPVRMMGHPPLLPLHTPTN